CHHYAYVVVDDALHVLVEGPAAVALECRDETRAAGAAAAQAARDRAVDVVGLVGQLLSRVDVLVERLGRLTDAGLLEKVLAVGDLVGFDHHRDGPEWPLA